MDKIYFSKLKEEAKIPTKREEDGAYDVYACCSFVRIEPGEIVKVPTGIASAFSSKYRIVFQERGSTGNIGLKVNAGLIDSGYRGEWFVVLNNTTNNTILLTERDKKYSTAVDTVIYPLDKAVCQAKVEEVPVVEIEEVPYEELLQFKSERGTGALGSTDK